MSTTARATAIFDADDGKFQATVKHIQETLGELEERFKTIAEVVGAAFVFDKAMEGVGKLVEGIAGVLEAGSRLKDLSEDTGVAVKDLVVLEEQFRAAGKSAEDLGPTLAKMQKAIAEGVGGTQLQQLGVDLNSLRGKTPVEQFEALGAAIASIENPTERTFLAMEMFGKSGASLISVFKSGFGDAAARVGDQARILGEDAGFFHEASVRLGESGLKVQGFFVGFADRVVPPLLVLLSKFENVDFSGLGQKLGDAINGVVYQSDLGEFFGNLLMLGAAEFVKFMVDGIATIADSLNHSLLAAAHSFLAVIDQGMANVAEQMSKIPGFGTAGHAAGGVLLGASIGETANANDEMGKIGWKKTGVADPSISAMQAVISGQLSQARATAGALHSAATAAFPTGSDDNSGAIDTQVVQPHVSHMASIGGAYGQTVATNANGDPLAEAIKKHDQEIELLKQIVQNTGGGGGGPRRPPQHPD